MQNNTLGLSAPWWRFGYVWLVLAGPVIVVIASFITLYLAVTRPDPVVTEDYYRKGIEINKTLGQDDQNDRAASLAPALLARNHAATGVVPPPRAPGKP